MKSILLAVIVIISIMPIYSQQVKPSIQLTQEEYLQRSKKQLKLGWTMLARDYISFGYRLHMESKPLTSL